MLKKMGHPPTKMYWRSACGITTMHPTIYISALLRVHGEGQGRNAAAAAAILETRLDLTSADSFGFQR